MRAKILYVSDLMYPARGRRYGDEDAYLTRRLREHFDLAVCHPLDALIDGFDAVVVRNSGPVLHYQTEHDEFRAAAIARGARVFNQLTGKADMIGKQYLVELSDADYPVIPTVDNHARSLPEATSYLVKPKLGSDSIGLRKVDPDELAQLFVDWNAIDHGIQRVDACRTRSGDLLLVELEDLNPYLSLQLTDEATREAFVHRMAESVTGLLRL